MKNTIQNNLVAAEAVKKAEEAARKAALKDVIRKFCCDFKEKSLNTSWQSQENSFKDYLERQLGLTFVYSPSNTIDHVTYLIAKYNYDDEGFMEQENICFYQRVRGVYGGCLVQLEDMNGNEITKLGRIK